jgi:serine/threonine protein phosphatase 1
MSYFFPRIRRGRRGRSGAEPRIPAGYRVYAVGDIHGRLDLLDELLAGIEADDRDRAAKNRSNAKTILIFLGDLIDRGPSSAQVIERLRNYAPRGIRPVHLIGNHEEVLLRLIRGESQYLADWLRFGGAECARSYGIDPKAIRRMEPSRAVRLLRDKVPANHKSFLESFVDTFQVGDYLFVHAGIRPGVELAQQNQTDLRWIRNDFLESDVEHGFVVVHGHTISDEVQVRANRIGLDTGAYRSGVLTALGLEDGKRWFLQTGASCASESMSSSARLVAGEKVG